MVQVWRTEAGVIALRSNCAPFCLLAVIGASLAHTANRDNFWHRISPLQEVPRARVHDAQAAQKAELPVKTVQARMGHSSIVMTMDTYGHLFPSSDDGNEMADAEKALLA